MSERAVVGLILLSIGVVTLAAGISAIGWMLVELK